MKKYNEGYSLPLVLVVMVIMCLVSVSIMSVSLHNLQSQKGYIDTMQDQYAAQGEIEKMVAEFTDISYNDRYNNPESAQPQAALAVQEITGITINDSNWVANDESGYDCKITITVNAPNSTVQVTCSVILENLIVEYNEGSDKYYKVTAPQFIYKSYEISASEGGTQ